MYNFVNAVALSRSIGSQWVNVNLSNIVVFNIFDTYSKVYLELSNTVLKKNVYVDMDTLKNEFSSYDKTLTDLLIDIRDRTLATVDTLPSTTVRFAKYSDAIRSEYKIELTKVGMVNIPNYPESELVDLRLSRPKYDTDMRLIHRFCLVSVNGMFHATTADDTYSYVYDGGTTLRHAKLNHLGILSFLDIGELTKFPIKESNIKSQPQSTLKEKIFFSVDGDFENKSVILVLGGYLVFESENIFKRVGKNVFSLDINNIPYIARLFESSRYLDLSDLELTQSKFGKDLVNVEELYSDKTLIKYLTLSQSFLVSVNKPGLSVNKIHIRHSSFPGMFTAYQDPTYPLMVGYGKIAEYWKTYEDGQWAVNIEDSFYRNLNLNHQQTDNLLNVNDNVIPNLPFYNSHGYLLEIAGFSF